MGLVEYLTIPFVLNGLQRVLERYWVKNTDLNSA
jgi:hypothetical protein